MKTHRYLILAGERYAHTHSEVIRSTSSTVEGAHAVFEQYKAHKIPIENDNKGYRSFAEWVQIFDAENLTVIREYEEWIDYDHNPETGEETKP